MAKKYYIWKAPACGEDDIEWLELSGKEFFYLLKEPKNRNRRFIRLGNDVVPEADIIYIEATEAQYREWRREQNTADYLRRTGHPFQTVSLDSPTDEEAPGSLGDTLADPTADVEGQALARIFRDTPDFYFRELSPDECRLLTDRYIRQKSLVQIASELGISQPAVTKRLAKLLNHLRSLF